MYSTDENLLAILGPTNTGKTYLAFEKLFSHNSGMFGFPLRLLARENYDKAVKRIGLNKVALITGEEKIVPKEACYFFCTVESLPTNKNLDCVIIDEVQMASDYERGHIFTDRILNLRGSYETIFLGSLNIKNILIKLFPKIKIEQKERFSKLSFLPKQNLSKLRPRSAIIAFNINKVYEIAENIRTHKGGAAIVLGSLSPRTRNAQVDVYENNKVDFLVATDAIGMGLNLNINHVCFTSIEKFDGRYNRNLQPNELGQIAGRAGRYKNDGTFGHTKEAGILDPILIQSIENHTYDQIQKIYWRNSDLDFSSINALSSSLKKYPIQSFFIHKKNAIDEINFRNLVDDNEINNYLNKSENIKLLWEVCRIPDFEKIFNDNYLTFLKTTFLKLIKYNYKLPEDWIYQNISRLENFDGGIPELSIKVSQIRKWTYIAYHQEWLEKPIYWQEKTQKIENDLSDNLHINLTNKFIDNTSKYFLSTSEYEKIEKVEVNNMNEIILDDLKCGVIKGFDIIFNKKLFSHSLFSLSHVKKSIRNMIEEKIENFLNAPDNSLSFGDIYKIKINGDVNVYWGDDIIGRLAKGPNAYSPIAEAINSEFLSSEKKLLVSAKLQNWIDNEVTTCLKPIKDKLEDDISPNVRAIAFNCFENLGTLEIDNFKDFIKDIDSKSKLQLSKLGIRIGAKYFFMPNLMKKKPIELNAILWKNFNDFAKDETLPLPTDGRVSFSTHIQMPLNYWQSIGYLCINNFAFRVDVFEKIFFLIRKKIKNGPFLESSDIMNPIGCNSSQLKDIIEFCGYDSINLSDGRKLYYFKQNKINTKKKKTKNKKNQKNIKKQNTKTDKIQADPNSPFAVLEKLL